MPRSVKRREDGSVVIRLNGRMVVFEKLCLDEAKKADATGRGRAVINPALKDGVSAPENR